MRVSCRGHLPLEGSAGKHNDEGPQVVVSASPSNPLLSGGVEVEAAVTLMEEGKS